MLVTTGFNALTRQQAPQTAEYEFLPVVVRPSHQADYSAYAQRLVISPLLNDAILDVFKESMSPEEAEALFNDIDDSLSPDSSPGNSINPADDQGGSSPGDEEDEKGEDPGDEEDTSIRLGDDDAGIGVSIGEVDGSSTQIEGEINLPDGSGAEFELGPNGLDANLSGDKDEEDEEDPNESGGSGLNDVLDPLGLNP